MIRNFVPIIIILLIYNPVSFVLSQSSCPNNGQRSVQSDEQPIEYTNCSLTDGTDTWMITTSQNLMMTIDVMSDFAGDGFDPVISLSTNEVQIISNDDSGGSLNSRIQNILVQADTEYTLTIEPFSSVGNGIYELRVTFQEIERQGDIRIDDTVSAELPQGESHVYTVNLQVGNDIESLTVNLNSNTTLNGFDTVLYLYQGASFTINDDFRSDSFDSRLEAIPLIGNEVFIVVTAYQNNGGGQYELTVEAVENKQPKEGNIPNNQMIVHELEPQQDSQWWQLEHSDFKIGSALQFRVESEAFDPEIRIDNTGTTDAFVPQRDEITLPEGDNGLTDTDGGEGLNSELTVRWTGNESDYSIDVFAEDDLPGEYTIIVENLIPFEERLVTNLLLDIPFIASLPPRTQHRIPLQSGLEGEHCIRLFSMDFDTYLVLTKDEDPEQYIDRNDDWNNSRHYSQIIHVLEASTTYYARISPYLEGEGRYTLTLEAGNCDYG